MYTRGTRTHFSCGCDCSRPSQDPTICEDSTGVTAALTARAHQGWLSKGNVWAAHRERLRDGARCQLQLLRSSLSETVLGWVVPVKEKGVCLTQAASCGI